MSTALASTVVILTCQVVTGILPQRSVRFHFDAVSLCIEGVFESCMCLLAVLSSWSSGSANLAFNINWKQNMEARSLDISLGQAPTMHATCHDCTARQLPVRMLVHNLTLQILRHEHTRSIAVRRVALKAVVAF